MCDVIDFSFNNLNLRDVINFSFNTILICVKSLISILTQLKFVWRHWFQFDYNQCGSLSDRCWSEQDQTFGVWTQESSGTRWRTFSFKICLHRYYILTRQSCSYCARNISWLKTSLCCVFRPANGCSARCSLVEINFPTLNFFLRTLKSTMDYIPTVTPLNTYVIGTNGICSSV